MLLIRIAKSLLVVLDTSCSVARLPPPIGDPTIYGAYKSAYLLDQENRKLTKLDFGKLSYLGLTGKYR